jgi:hypothetical protein
LNRISIGQWLDITVNEDGLICLVCFYCYGNDEYKFYNGILRHIHLCAAHSGI